MPSFDLIFSVFCNFVFFFAFCRNMFLVLFVIYSCGVGQQVPGFRFTNRLKPFPSRDIGGLFGQSVASDAAGLTLVVGYPQSVGYVYVYNRSSIYDVFETAQELGESLPSFCCLEFKYHIVNIGVGTDMGETVGISSNGTVIVATKRYAASGSGVSVFVKEDDARGWILAQDISVGRTRSCAVSNSGSWITIVRDDRLFVYQRSGNLWTQTQNIATNTYQEVRMTDDFIVAGGLLNVPLRVYSRSGTTWSLQQSLSHPGTPSSNRRFGYVLAISRDGTTIAAGDEGDSSGGFGVNPKSIDPNLYPNDRGGAVFVFRYSSNSSSWMMSALIKCPQGDNGCELGMSVALSNDGSLLAAGNTVDFAPGVLVNPPKVGAGVFVEAQGSAYLYFRQPDNHWSPAYAILKPDVLSFRSRFGSALAFGDGLLIVSANKETSGGEGVNPPFTGGSIKGVALVYEIQNVNLGQSSSSSVSLGNTNIIKAPLGSSDFGMGRINREFGQAVDLSSDGLRMVIGQPNNELRTSGSCTDYGNFTIDSFVGALYIYKRASLDSAWQLECFIKPEYSSGPALGHGVAMDYLGLLVLTLTSDGDGMLYSRNSSSQQWDFVQKIVVQGTPTIFSGIDSFLCAATNAVAVGGENANVNGTNSGALHVYRRVSTGNATFVLEQILINTSPQGGDKFGKTCSFNRIGTKIAVSATSDNTVASNKGAVLVFAYDGASWVLEQKLLPGIGDSGSMFGTALQMNGVGDALLIASSNMFYNFEQGTSGMWSEVVSYNLQGVVQVATFSFRSSANMIAVATDAFESGFFVYEQQRSNVTSLGVFQSYGILFFPIFFLPDTFSRQLGRRYSFSI